jgi:hypothetical protein
MNMTNTMITLTRRSWVAVDAEVEDGLGRGDLAHEEAHEGHGGGDPERHDEG